MDNIFTFIKRHSAVITSIFVFMIYLLTLAPSVIQIDSGELAAVQKTLGIAHPTGYPLFTIIGFLFLKIPMPFTDIFKSNLLAAIWCSLGVYMFIKSSQLILSNIKKQKTDKKIKSNEPINNPEALIIIPSVLGGLFLAFGKTYWAQSTSVEVYSLQAFLFNLIIFAALKAYFREGKNIFWIFTALSLTLGFANHMTTLLILPFIAVLFFKKEKFNSAALKKILIMLAVFFPLLAAFYAYLPIRASFNPQINWGNVINFENFWRHFTGKQYSVWLFSSIGSAEKQLTHFVKNLPMEFTYIGLVIVITGVFASFKYSKIIFYGMLVAFLSTVLYSINYDIVDIDSYFLLAYISSCFFAVMGFRKFVDWFSSKRISYMSIFILTVPVLAEGTIYFSQVSQSGINTFEDYTKAVLNFSEKNSVIFTYQWDYFVSPSYYFQYAENYRKDVAVIDKELLRRSWYYNQMNRNYPSVIKNIQPEINSFLESLKPFEHDENFDPNIIEKNFRKMMTNLVAQNCEEKNFYIGLELFQNEMQKGEFSLPDGYQVIPDLLMFKVVRGNEYVPAKDPDFKIRMPVNGNVYTDNIRNFVCTMLAYRAQYELIYNKKDRARIYIDKIRNDFPGFSIPAELLKKLE